MGAAAARPGLAAAPVVAAVAALAAPALAAAPVVAAVAAAPAPAAAPALGPTKPGRARA